MKLATVLAAVTAWKSRDISSKFSEADWIFYAIFAPIQVWAVGFPTLIVLDATSVDAAYLGRVMIDVTFSVSMILLIFGPIMLESSGKTYRPSVHFRGESAGMGHVVVIGVLNRDCCSFTSNSGSETHGFSSHEPRPDTSAA